MNLLNLLKYQLGSNLTDQLSNFLGEKPELVQSALDATLPSVLSVFVRKAADKTGANEIMDTIKHGNHDGSMLNYLTGLFSGGSSTNSLMSSGDILANRFLGNKRSVLMDAIMKFSGIKKDAAGSLVKIAMPLILGVIGKQVKNQRMDVSGLMNLLSGQKGHIGAAIPSGFAIGNYSSKPTTPVTKPVVQQTPVVKATTKKTTTISKPKPTINETIAKQQVSTAKNVEVKTAPPKVKKNETPALLKFLPFILGGFLLLSLLIFGIRSCSKNKATAKTTKKTTKPIATNDTKTVDAETKEPTTEDIADHSSNNSESSSDSNNSSSDYSNDNSAASSNYNYEPAVSSIPGEVKQQLDGMISGGNANGSTISLDGLRFNGNSVIHRGSRHILSELADVMNSNPSLNIRLESSKIGKAVSVKKGLMDAGIDRNRIETTSGSSSKVQLSLL